MHAHWPLHYTAAFSHLQLLLSTTLAQPFQNWEKGGGGGGVGGKLQATINRHTGFSPFLILTIQ